MTDTNGNNGHPASLSDVFSRVGKLESSMETFRGDLRRLEDGQTTILNAVMAIKDKNADAIASLKDKNADAVKPNYAVAISFCGLCFVVGGAILAAAVAPLMMKDTYHERDQSQIESIIRADHDRITRLEERERLYRETGTIGVR